MLRSAYHQARNAAHRRLSSGVDIASPLSNREVGELHQALADFQVLFFHDQRFTLDSQKALGRLFRARRPRSPARLARARSVRVSPRFGTMLLHVFRFRPADARRQTKLAA